MKQTQTSLPIYVAKPITIEVGMTGRTCYHNNIKQALNIIGIILIVGTGEICKTQDKEQKNSS